MQLSRALQCQIVNDDFICYNCSTPAVIDTYVAKYETTTRASGQGKVPPHMMFVMLIMVLRCWPDSLMPDDVPGPLKAIAGMYPRSTASQKVMRGGIVYR